MIKRIDKEELQKLTGLNKTQTNHIFKQARLTLAQMFPIYNNKRISVLPISSIENIIGYKIYDENDIIVDVQKVGSVSKENTHDSY